MSSSAGAAEAVGPLRAAISGVGWLVRNGSSFLAQSAAREPLSPGFEAEIAPRTALGIDEWGNLLLVVVDGDESTKQGATLPELIQILLSAQIGAHTVINLDGGGSSVAVQNGQVIRSALVPSPLFRCLATDSQSFCCAPFCLCWEQPPDLHRHSQNLRARRHHHHVRARRQRLTFAPPRNSPLPSLHVPYRVQPAPFLYLVLIPFIFQYLLRCLTLDLPLSPLMSGVSGVSGVSGRSATPHKWCKAMVKLQ